MIPTANSRAVFKNLLILLGLILLLLFWTKPTWQTIINIHQSLVSEELAIKNSTSTANWSTVNAYLNAKEKELINANNLFQTKGQELAFFAKLENLAEREGLNISLHLETNNPIIIPQAETLTINATTDGDKTKVLAFLQSLENEPGIVLTQINLNSSDGIKLSLQAIIQSFWR